MTDVKPANTPNKRKSFANDGNKPQSAKKTKPNNQATPKKTVNGTPNKQMQTPNKQKQTPFKQNESAKKAKQTPNKPPVKKFGGTATLSPKVPQEGSVSPKIQKKPINKQEKQKGQPKQLKGPINPKKLEKQTGEGRKRRTLYPVIIQKIKSGEKKEALADIEQRIADLEKRSEKTKTSIRKLKLLKRLRKLSDGTAEQKVQIDKKQANVPQVKAKAQNANNKTVKQGAKPVQNKPGKKTQLVIKKDEEDSEEKLEDSDGEEDDSEEGDEESDEGEEDSDEGEGDSDDDEEDSDEDGDEIENSANEEVKKVKNAPTPKNIKTNNENKPNNKSSKQKDISLDQLKKDSLVKSDQKRYVLFVGNISYDTNKDELNEHFKKVGEIRHIRVPTDQKTNRPRGFAYVEVTNEESYQKCLSLHHSSLKGRRINVEYTQGGKKKGDDRKKEIKAKNFKLHAMRKQGQLVGSQKQSQKRTFRRNKKNVKHDE